MMSNPDRGPAPHLSPAPREPIFNVPTVVAGLVGVFLLVHGVREMAPAFSDFFWLYRLAFVPARVSWWLDPGGFLPALAARAQELPPETAAAWMAMGRMIVHQDTLAPWTFVTHAFLHGSWTHVGLNAVWLVAFGSPLASRFGAARFLAFFLVCAVGGAAAHYLSTPMDVIPMVGASGAISGCMGAAMRFAFNVRGGLFGGPASIHFAHADSLRETLRNRRALLFGGAWLVINVVFGLLAGPLGVTPGEVAWQAHIGGFVTGLALFGLFDPFTRPSGAGRRPGGPGALH
ncbi:rhomboid family intramembrane serine protease [Camelimonas abortus]|uniref:Rhomboid family intramembrane serine protease n=1 Tax=Camelimonas abortus TaxID=1017184 RepID=A0ABV7LGN7_9HYPH